MDISSNSFRIQIFCKKMLNFYDLETPEICTNSEFNHYRLIILEKGSSYNPVGCKPEWNWPWCRRQEQLPDLVLRQNISDCSTLVCTETSARSRLVDRGASGKIFLPPLTPPTTGIRTRSRQRCTRWSRWRLGRSPDRLSSVSPSFRMKEEKGEMSDTLRLATLLFQIFIIITFVDGPKTFM